ncbi:N-acetyltransferase [Alginatibacterium sediminis]|uniref:N-acetyltransferase n=1 Tax=Alginatibacterium sediminis TaxID=2164068 RepID=A0A420EBJ3_9ALTE|nr:GNAT family protein [Alginatibacterium sediminis]RKF18045.1 N-acetyltransferase [Alginatibacterium sediminis]
MISLREFQLEDAPHLLRILNTPSVVKYLSSKIPYPYTEQDAQWWIVTGSKQGIVKAITVNGLFVGCIAASRGEFEHRRSAEVGYWISDDYWRQGIASQAMKDLSDLVFETSDIVRLFASVFSPNKGSMAVLAKCGFELESIQKMAIFKHDRFYNEHIYSLIKAVP